jgi:predicted DNA-binding antitoxin AbrB/MazE fold protein
MTLTVEATYENGVLKLKEPLPLREQQMVRVTIEHDDSPPQRAYGIVGWTGSLADLDYLIEDAANDPLEGP